MNKGVVPVLTVIFLVIASFLKLTPFLLDDFCYGADTPSFSDIIPAEINQYFGWTGRSVAHIIARFLLLCDPVVHIFFTALIFIGIILSMLVLVHGRAWKEKTDMFQVVLLFFLLWFSVPKFGQVFFWRVGSANYAWTGFLILVCMAEYRLLLDCTEKILAFSWPRIVYLSCLGLLAGWTNENTGIIPLLFATGVLLYLHYGRKVAIPARIFVPVALIGVGYLCMILAPGNYLRLQQPSFEWFRTTPAYLRLLPFLHTVMQGYLKFSLTTALLLGTFVLLFRFFRKDRKRTWTPPLVIYAVFVLFAFMSTAAFFFSPHVPLRAWSGICLLLIVALCAWYVAYSELFPYKKALLTVMIVLLVGSISYNLRIFYKNACIDEVRTSILANAAGKEVAIPPYGEEKNRYFFIGDGGVNDDPEYWVNRCIARYYGLPCVKAAKEPLWP